MIRKIYLRVRWGILGIVIAYLLFAGTYALITLLRLETIEGNSNFDVTTVLNISKDRITAESETYNRGVFIQYNCVIDSTYFLTLVRVGKMTNIKLPNGLCFQDHPFPSRRGFNHNIGFVGLGLSSNFMPSYIALYNVFLLPLKEVDKINIFVEGKMISKDCINDTTVSYFVIPPELYNITFSFNNINKRDLEFSSIKGIKATPINILFTIDADRNLYIGCASTATGTPKTLSEILNEGSSCSDEAVK